MWTLCSDTCSKKSYKKDKYSRHLMQAEAAGSYGGKDYGKSAYGKGTGNGGNGGNGGDDEVRTAIWLCMQQVWFYNLVVAVVAVVHSERAIPGT